MAMLDPCCLLVKVEDRLVLSDLSAVGELAPMCDEVYGTFIYKIC